MSAPADRSTVVRRKLAWGLGLLLLTVPPTACVARWLARGHFTPAAWQAAGAESELGNPRLDMVHDLLAHHLRAGLTRAEVLSLLGEPDERDAADQEWRYWLGFSRFMPIDPDVLEIHFDPQGRLIRAWWHAT